MSLKVFEFADFELDCDRFELRRAGRSLKLERKPMELLILLAAKEGHLVTRTEIAEHLWDREVFVDTEHGINTAVRKIREVLRDDPEQPRFVQTVTGKGYRFIGTVLEARPSLPEPRLPPPATQESSVRSARESTKAIPVPPIALPIPARRSWLPAMLAALVFVVVALALGARALRGRATGAKITSLAVLPLDNLSGDSSQDYFADGMTDELTTMLAKNSTLRVISRTSVMQYKGVHRPLPEIARELGVDGVLEGSVSRTGDKVHMTIQLIQASSDSHVWAESYDRDANDIVSLPREAALTIAKRLNSTSDQPKPTRYVSPEAHDAYLRGRYLWFTDHTEMAGPYFKKATELQPDYALGWSGLAIYYGASAVKGDLSPAESLPQEEAAAARAIELDNSLPEAHLAMSGAAMLRWNLAQADQEALRAIELDPKFAEPYHLRAKILNALNRQREAIEAQKKATELDPFTRTLAVTQILVAARQCDAALNDALQRLESDPNDPALYRTLSRIYHLKGMEKESAQWLEKAYLQDGDKASAMEVRRAFEQDGNQALLLWRLNRLNAQSSKKYVSPLEFANVYAQLGRREEALTQLEEGYRQHSPGMLWIQNDPAYDFFHSDERYRSLIRNIGLPPAY